eukprot:6189430-Pleurochrysis_carterae.AAC.1
MARVVLKREDILVDEGRTQGVEQSARSRGTPARVAGRLSKETSLYRSHVVGGWEYVSDSSLPPGMKQR